MKKHLLLFGFSTLGLVSCKYDDVQGYELDMLKGEWKTVKTEVISGEDHKTVIKTMIPTGCETKNILKFRPDHYVSYHSFSGTGADCSSSETEGTYTYDHEKKYLVTKFNNDSERVYELIILSNSELKTMTMSDNVDQNGDSVVDYTYTTYKR